MPTKAGRADQKATDKPVAQQVEQTPDADKYGVVHADQWAGDYPYQYQTYKQNDANGTEGKHDYLQLYPALNTMYKGICLLRLATMRRMAPRTRSIR